MEIPLTGATSHQTVRKLLENTLFAAHKEQWLIETTCVPLLKENLLLAHDAEYVERLFSDDAEMLRIYELVDEHGDYYRYKPEQAELPISNLLDRVLRLGGGTV